MGPNDKYEDIINLPHHVSDTRKRMSMEMRAAQFSPFAALTGYDEEIDETARLTGEKRDISFNEGKTENLDRTIAYLNEHSSYRIPVKVTYLIPDKKKDGGEYAAVTGEFKRLDMSDQALYLTDGRKIFLKEIYDIVLLGNYETEDLT